MTMLNRLRDQQGAYTVMGLLMLVGMIIPMVYVLRNTAIVSNASSQAEGMSYNLSYMAANRAVDQEATAGGQSIQFGNNQNDPKIYQDIATAQQAMERAAKISAQRSIEWEMVPFPDSPVFTGGGSMTGGPGRIVGLASVGMDPTDARRATVSANIEDNRGYRAQDADVCQPDNSNPLHANGGRYRGSNLVCWVDQRAMTDPASGAWPYWGPLKGGEYMYKNSWAHFSSGAQARLRFKVKLWGGGGVRGDRIGVATFGRPCVTRDDSCLQ